VSAADLVHVQASRASALIVVICTVHVHSHSLPTVTQKGAAPRPKRTQGGERPTVKDINKRIAAETSWSRTADRRARTRPARQAFLSRFEREVDPDGKLPPAERRRRAQHALRAHMLRLAKRSVSARRQTR